MTICKFRNGVTEKGYTYPEKKECSNCQSPFALGDQYYEDMGNAFCAMECAEKYYGVTGEPGRATIEDAKWANVMGYQGLKM